MSDLMPGTDLVPVFPLATFERLFGDEPPAFLTITIGRRPRREYALSGEFLPADGGALFSTFKSAPKRPKKRKPTRRERRKRLRLLQKRARTATRRHR